MSDILAAADAIVDAALHPSRHPERVIVELSLDVTDRDALDAAYRAFCDHRGAVPERGLLQMLDDIFGWYADSTPGLVVRARGTGVDG